MSTERDEIEIHLKIHFLFGLAIGLFIGLCFLFFMNNEIGKLILGMFLLFVELMLYLEIRKIKERT